MRLLLSEFPLVLITTYFGIYFRVSNIRPMDIVQQTLELYETVCSCCAVISTRHSRVQFLALLVMLGCSLGPVSNGAVKLDTVGAFLTSHGYGGAQLVGSGRFYHLPVRSNGKLGNLVVDTGTPMTLIFRSNLNRLGLMETRTNRFASGVFGRGQELYGLAMVPSLFTGNCILSNIPVVVTSDLGSMQRYGTPYGCLGLRELTSFGAILDLAHHMVYFRPAPPDRQVSVALKSMLQRAGWKPVQLFQARQQLHAPGRIAGIPCRLIVDTGTPLTAVDRGFALRAKLGGSPTEINASGIGRSGGRVSMTSFSSLSIGDYQVKGASAAVVNLDSAFLGRGSEEVAGLLGVEYLADNSAILDFISGTLYLRPHFRR